MTTKDVESEVVQSRIEPDAAGFFEILSTKLYIPPKRESVVRRSRLLHKLERSSASHLILISAPAGFGKTTLMADWLASMPPDADNPRSAWLTLEESDNHLKRFWRYVVAALQSIDPQIGRRLSSLLSQPTLPPVESWLPLLINDLATVRQRIILVLDDYHAIHTPAIHHSLHFFLAHLPPSVRLAFLTRADPPLPLARFRVQGSLLELRAADMRFSSEEIERYLNEVLKLDLAPADISALEQRTEGWPAGIELAARSLQGFRPADRREFIASFSGSNRLVLSYLLEEVLNQQTPDRREFLLRTSVLARLSGPLCQAITGQTESASILVELSKDNFFITPLDPDGVWYRCHPLLADSLATRLREDSPQLWNDLHRLAGDWCARNGHLDRAINHAIKSQDYFTAASLIETIGEQTWTSGEIGTLLHWLDSLPPAVIESQIDLRLLYTWVLFLHDRWDEATGQWQAAGADLDHLDVQKRKACRGRWAAIGAAMAGHRREPEQTIRLAQQALNDLPSDDLAWRIVSNIDLGLAYMANGDMSPAHGAFSQAADLSIARQNAYLVFASLGHLSEVCMVQGNLYEAQATCERLRQCEAIPGGKVLALAANADIGLGIIAYERNDLIVAERLLRHGLEQIWPGGQPRVVLRARVALCRLYVAENKWLEAAEQIDQAAMMVAQLHMPAEGRVVAAYQAWLGLRQGHLEVVQGWLTNSHVTANDTPDYRHESEHRILAEALIAQNRFRTAESLLQTLVSASTQSGRTGDLIALLAMLAISVAGQKRFEEAEELLRQALTLAHPQGYVRTIVDLGLPMNQLLRRTAVRSQNANYVNQLLQAFDPPDAGFTGRRFGLAEPAGNAVLLDELTPREWEILNLIATGASNSEIAEKLVLSVGTVKGHINHIFSKLDVHSRTAAVARARELGLIPP